MEHCNLVRLKDDFTVLKPFDDGEYYKVITPENYVEGPTMFKRNGKYYFMPSQGGWFGPDHLACLPQSVILLSFVSSPRIGVVSAQDPEIGTGSRTSLYYQTSGTDEYYIVYHRHPLNHKNRHHRYTCIEMTFDEKVISILSK